MQIMDIFTFGEEICFNFSDKNNENMIQKNPTISAFLIMPCYAMACPLLSVGDFPGQKIFIYLSKLYRKTSTQILTARN